MDKEYIPREAALKAIHTSTAPALEVKYIPAADVVEVVRCRECKHAEPYGLYGLDLKCNKHSGSPKTKLREEICYIELHTPHFFCSDGEPKDGEQDDAERISTEYPCQDYLAMEGGKNE